MHSSTSITSIFLVSAYAVRHLAEPHLILIKDEEYQQLLPLLDQTNRSAGRNERPANVFYKVFLTHYCFIFSCCRH